MVKVLSFEPKTGCFVEAAPDRP